MINDCIKEDTGISIQDMPARFEAAAEELLKISAWMRHQCGRSEIPLSKANGTPLTKEERAELAEALGNASMKLVGPAMYFTDSFWHATTKRPAFQHTSLSGAPALAPSPQTSETP